MTTNKLYCPHCNRCLGVFHATDASNSVCEVNNEKPKKVKGKGHIFHSTCRRCKREVYVLMGFTD